MIGGYFLMKNKTILSFFCLMTCAAVFSGCGNSTDAPTADSLDSVTGTESNGPTSSPPQEITPENGVIELTVWSEANNFDLLNEMAESFKQAHAGEAEINITLVESADSATKSNLLGDVHNAADIFPIADDQLSAMVGAGALEPVPNADAVRAANLEDAVNAATVNDTLYAYPMTADNGYFMYYNKEYFTDEDVKTLDGMLAKAEEAEKKITMEWSSGWYMFAFFGNTGLEFGINEDGVTNYCNWNTTEGKIKGTDIANSLLAIAASPGFENRPDSEFLAGVQDGSVIAGVSGVWNAMEIKDAWGGNFGAVKLPTFACAGQQIQMSSFVGYKMIGVNAYSKHKEWALKFADWITNEENQNLRFAKRGQGPSNINAAASEEVQKTPAIAAVLDQSQYGTLQRVGNNYWTPFMTFGETMAAGNPNGTDLQEIMDTLVSGITASTVQ